MLESARLGTSIAVPVLMLFLAWVSTMLRCWVKRTILKSFAWDDGLMLIALVYGTFRAVEALRRKHGKAESASTTADIDAMANIVRRFQPNNDSVQLQDLCEVCRQLRSLSPPLSGNMK